MRHLRNTMTLAFVLMVATLSADAKDSGAFVPDQLICAVTDSQYIDQVNSIYHTTTVSYLPQIYGYLLQTQPGINVDSLATLITSDANIIYCTPNYLADAPEPVQGSQPFIDLNGTNSDFVQQPATTQLALAPAQQVSTGAHVRVAVIDVGVDPTHPVLSGTIVAGQDYVDGDMTPTDTAGGRASGHGTFVAGIIHLVAPQAEIHAYRVLDTAGTGNGYAVAEAILQAVADSCRVINLSLVMGDKHGTVDAAIEYARNQNVLVIASGGNDGIELDRFPATDSYVLGVVSVDSTDHKSTFATYHQKLDVCAPGTSVYGPFLDSTYAWWNGSSFAAPFVSGEAALIISRKPEITWNDLFDAITLSAVNVDSLNPLYAGKLGSGVVNVAAALSQAGIICGDVDQDGAGPDMGDLTALVDHLYISILPLPNPDMADIDGQAGIDIGDITAMVNQLFVTFAPLDCTN